MNNIYFTADLHFGHTNILKHCSERPFAADVGIDGALSRQLPGGFGFPTIEQIYETAQAKAGTENFEKYASASYRSEVK